MPTLLAKNASVLVTMDDGRRELSNAGLFVRDGMIEQVGPTQQLPQRADLVLDLSGQIVLPGFVNTHHHLDQTLTRNLPAAQNNNLFPWLKVHYRVWASRTPEASRCSTLIGLAELAASGCTTVFDHAYVFKNGSRVDDQIAAAREIGVRFHACRGSMSLGESRGGLPPDDCVEDEPAILKDCVRAIEAYHDRSRGAMTRLVLGPCSPFSVSTDLLKESAKLARAYEVPLHTHLCETMDEERYTLERYQLRPVAWMATLGWLGSDVWFAHAIHVNDDEIQEMARAGVRGGALPQLEHAAGLRHRAGQEVSGRGREGRAGRRWVREQRRVEHAARGATGPACWRGCASASCRRRARGRSSCCRSRIRCARTSG